MTATLAQRLGVVAIGRNEGERLRACLVSARKHAINVVYVDSGSSDNSISIAEALGVHVVQLDLTTPFTAARSRNAGCKQLMMNAPDIEFVQFMDGDCEIVEGWIPRALAEMQNEDNRQVAVVCGRRRERAVEASVYNHLIDMEWDTPLGDVESCGGDALIRTEAFREVGGYDERLIAGEEPEMCWRLRHAGWTVRRIDAEMTLHDAQMHAFRQWWKRSVRAGHAYAEGHAMHGRVDGFCGHAMQSAVQWALVLPLIAFALAWFTWGASLILLAGYVVLWWRIRENRVREHKNDGAGASLYANYCVAGKFAEMQGVAKYWWNRARGKRSSLIEYKRGATSMEASMPGAER